LCGLHDVVKLEARGVPAVTLCMEALMNAAAHAYAYESPDARVVAVQHPLAALASEAVLQRADAVVEGIIAQLVTAH
jgi:hypothetical protein